MRKAEDNSNHKGEHGFMIIADDIYVLCLKNKLRNYGFSLV